MVHEFFSDEIAIDFPSVGRVVDRMRDAFLGDRGPECDLDDRHVLMAEVSLSTREAQGGRIVPVEVPIRGTCEACGGRGETWSERCGRCRGTGDALFQHTVHVTLPPGVADGACFRFRVNSPHASSVRVEVRVAIRSSAT
jgi:hypothetical protein